MRISQFKRFSLFSSQETRVEMQNSVGMDVINPNANFATTGHRGRGNKGRRTQGLGQSHGRGRGRTGSQGNGSKLVCQICGKQGHTTLACWHCMDESYHPTQAHHQENTTNNKVSFLATPKVVAEPRQYGDSGATNHITLELENLTFANDYHGNDKLMFAMVIV